jgi:AcrR family transcriptional regulator
VTTTSSAVPAAAVGRRAEAEVERRARILDAATQLFDAQGFEGTTTDDIAAAAGVTKRTLYRYMGSKEHLLFEIHDRFLRDLLADVTSQSGTPEERFRAMVVAQLRVLADHLQEVKVFFEEIKHLSDAKRAELVQVRKAYEDVLNEILADGVASGVFADRDLRLTGRGILGALNETYRWFRAEGPYTPDQMADLLADFFLNGIAPRRKGSPVTRQGIELLADLPEPEAGPDHDQPMGRIVTAATQLFRQKGYHGTNTRELADAAGVTKGALFYHVGHKEGVLVRIHEMVTDRAVSVLSRVDRAEAPTAEVVARMMVAHSRLIAQDRDAVAVASEEMKYLPEEALARVIARRQDCQRLLEAAVVRGTDRGELVTEDPRLVSLMIIGMLNSTYRWYRPDGPFSPDDMGLAFADLVLHGLRTETGRQAGKPAAARARTTRKPRSS